MSVGSSLRLDDDFISVAPKSQKSKLNCNITVKSGSIDNIVFENNIISALKSGYYYFNFSVVGQNDIELKETLKIHVFEASKDPYLNLITNKINEGDSVDFSRLFNLYGSPKDKKVQTNDLIKFENNKFFFLDDGLGTIKITLVFDYYKIDYEFKIQIQKKISTNPDDYDYDIEFPPTENNPPKEDELPGVSDIVITATYEFEFKENKKYKIPYVVTDNGHEYVNQSVKCISLDTSIVEVYESIDLFITIICKSKGTALIEIYSEFDPSVKKIIEIHLI